MCHIPLRYFRTRMSGSCSQPNVSYTHHEGPLRVISGWLMKHPPGRVAPLRRGCRAGLRVPHDQRGSARACEQQNAPRTRCMMLLAHQRWVPSPKRRAGANRPLGCCLLRAPSTPPCARTLSELKAPYLLIGQSFFQAALVH